MRPACAHAHQQGHNPSAAPTCKGDADEREEDMEEIESASIATLANMGSFKSDRDKSQLMASSIEKAQEEMSSLRTRMDHMGDSFQSAPYAVSSRRSGGGDGLSAGGGGSSAKGMSSSTQKGRERVERGERAERVQRVGRDWQGGGAGAGAAGSGEGVGGKALGKTLCSTSLTSSSNEESGITDGSSTHGNGTSNGSWLESGSDKPSSEPSCPDTESSKHPSTTNSEGVFRVPACSLPGSGPPCVPPPRAPAGARPCIPARLAPCCLPARPAVSARAHGKRLQQGI